MFVDQSMVLIANETIHDGEELTMDYRLNPNFPLPTWYSPVNEQNIQLRYQDPDLSLEDALTALSKAQSAGESSEENSDNDKAQIK